jgi:hypothetical protein
LAVGFFVLLRFYCGAAIATSPMLIPRQQGPAWDRPFIAVYGPFIGAENYSVPHRITGPVPAGHFYRFESGQQNQTEQLVLQSADREKDFGKDSWQFRAILGRWNTLSYLYLGARNEIVCQSYKLKGKQLNSAANLSIIAGKEFAVTCNQETAITLPGNRIKKVVLLEGSQKKELPFMKTKTGITFSVLACSQAGILLN